MMKEMTWSAEITDYECLLVPLTRDAHLLSVLFTRLFSESALRVLFGFGRVLTVPLGNYFGSSTTLYVVQIGYRR